MGAERRGGSRVVHRFGLDNWMASGAVLRAREPGGGAAGLEGRR